MPTANNIDRAKLKTELEAYGRKLGIMWHFKNDERLFVDLHLSLPLIQGKRKSLERHILAAWKKDY